MAGKIGVGIDVGTLGIKFVEMRLVQERVHLSELSFFPLPGNEDENFSTHSAQSLKQFLKTRGLKIKKALACISGVHLNIRYLRVPPVSAQRLAKIVAMDVEQVTSTALADLVYGYQPIDFPVKKNQQERLVAVAVAKSGFLDKLHNYFRQSKIHITGFVPAPYALYYAFIKLGKIPPNQMVYLVDIGHGSIDLALSYESTLFFMRNVNAGGNVITQAVQKEDFVNFQQAETFKIKNLDLAACLNKQEREEREDRKTLADEDQESALDKCLYAAHTIPDALEASLKYAKMQTKIPSLKTNCILITGGASRQKGISELLKTRMGQPVSFVNWDKSVFTYASPELKMTFEENADLYPIALGLAYLDCRSPGTMKMVGSRQKMRERIMGRQIFEYGALGISVLLALISIVITYSARSYYHRQKEQLTGKYQKLAQKADRGREISDKNRDLAKKVDLLANHVISNRRLVEAIDWLYVKMPAKMYLVEIKFEKETGKWGKLVLKGVVEEDKLEVSEELGNFQKEIKESLGWEVEGHPKSDEQDPKKLNFTLELTPAQYSVQK